MGARRDRLVEILPGIIAIVTLGVAGLLAVSGFGTTAAVVAVLGWFLLTPLSALLGEEVLGVEDEDEDEGGGRETDGRAIERRNPWWGTVERVDPDAPAGDPVERLRGRYAEGDIDEAEFERRLDALLETEGADVETAHERLRDLEYRRDRETERERG